MRCKSYLAVTGLALLSALPLTARAQFSGSLTLASDYVWRGASQTRERPALQGDLRYTHGSGFYASVWGSNVKYRPDNGAASEFDLAAGWNGALAEDWGADLYVQRYQYPGSDIGLNWNEVTGVLSWRERVWASASHSSNAMASKTRGSYLTLGLRQPLGQGWRLEGTLSRYLLQSRYADSYTSGSLGLAWAFKAPLEARLTLHATDSAARRLFPEMAGTRVVLSLQAGF